MTNILNLDALATETLSRITPIISNEGAWGDSVLQIITAQLQVAYDHALKAGRAFEKIDAAATPETTTLSEDQNDTVQEILNAIVALPDVMPRVDAYLRGRGFDDPPADIESLHHAVF